MFFNNIFGDKKTQPRAVGMNLNGVFCSKEFGKKAEKMLFGDADAFVFNRYFNRGRATAFKGYLYRTAGSGIINGVFQEIAKR